MLEPGLYEETIRITKSIDILADREGVVITSSTQTPIVVEEGSLKRDRF
ncbi:hypothetical protein [Alkalicoccus luteus]|uniref:Uncharacterized protein n=1 Tax=Alkalicoccus luteus TaxID=1237094 RepID=A0A969PSC6_9BACI|nr:hypothetical protein [Alkalicoccus luteus]NJP38640.1 hypothetical protein [Alkalicoccus luteus]